MLLNLLNQTLGMKFMDNDDPGGPIKFGGVEINTEGMTPEQITNITKAQDTYNSSSTAGIKAAKDLETRNKEFEAFKLEKGNAGGAGLTKDDIVKIMKEQMPDLNSIADRGRQLNLERTIEKTNVELRKEFAYLSDEQFSEAMKNVDVTFKNQDVSVRTGTMHKNIAKIALGDALNKNINSVNKDKAMELLMGNPEAMKELIDSYSTIMGIDVNMPPGGTTNQKDFETKMNDLNADFAKEKNSEKRKMILQEIADTRAVGSNLGFKL